MGSEEIIPFLPTAVPALPETWGNLAGTSPQKAIRQEGAAVIPGGREAIPEVEVIAAAPAREDIPEEAHALAGDSREAVRQCAVAAVDIVEEEDELCDDLKPRKNEKIDNNPGVKFRYCPCIGTVDV